MWEYVGVKMKHTQLPKKSGGILVVHMQLSVQMALHSLFFSVLASVRWKKLRALWCFEKQVFGPLSSQTLEFVKEITDQRPSQTRNSIPVCLNFIDSTFFWLFNSRKNNP